MSEHTMKSDWIRGVMKCVIIIWNLWHGAERRKSDLSGDLYRLFHDLIGGLLFHCTEMFNLKLIQWEVFKESVD